MAIALTLAFIVMSEDWHCTVEVFWWLEGVEDGVLRQKRHASRFSLHLVHSGVRCHGGHSSSGILWIAQQ
jgi:hypothetical protein